MSNSFFDRLQLLIANKKYSQKTLGGKIGVHEQTVSRWKKSEPGLKNILEICKVTGASLDWLRDGIGPMFATGEESGSYAEISSRPPPSDDERYAKLTSTKVEMTTDDDDDRPLSMADLLNMCEVVLESKTVYRPALASNLRAFYKAVKNEDEMGRMSEELQKTNAKVDEMMEMVKELLSAQKRDPEKKVGNSGGA